MLVGDQFLLESNEYCLVQTSSHGFGLVLVNKIVAFFKLELVNNVECLI